jgi:RNA polymerase sigma-70 factor (ECF subfamily)
MLDISTLHKIKEGDVQAFESLFKQYYAPLCLYAAGITGRIDIAEEIVQELFYVFWKERERLRVLQSVKAYLYGSVRNRSLQYCEHLGVENRYREMASVSGNISPRTPHELMEYKELQYLINRTLRKLPGRRRKIFRMHRVDGKKYAEIAEELSLSVKTIEAEMTQALQALRKDIEKYIKGK